MVILIAVVHLVVCLLLIALVLLQDPKNAGAGSVFGSGGSNTVLGATGATTFLTRLTRYSAVVFGVTCLILTLLSRPNTGSVIDAAPTNTAPKNSAPVAPAAPPSGHTDSAPAGGETAPAAPAPAAPQGK